MNAERNNFSERELDSLIDGALAGYAGEPRVGLENRMLARLRAEEIEQRSFFRLIAAALHWRWMMAGAVAATLIAATVVGLQIRRDRQTIAKQAPLAQQQI